MGCSGLECCPGGLIVLAVIGIVVLYLAAGLGINCIYKSINRKEDYFDEEAVFIILFYPVLAVGLVIYWIARVILLPFIAATKYDLENSEQRINHRIDSVEQSCTSVKDRCKNYSEVNSNNSNYNNGEDEEFYVGDLITGKKDNPGNYECYYNGCLARVLSVDPDKEHDLKVKLLDHMDKEANADRIGDINRVKSKYMIKIKPKTKKVVKRVIRKTKIKRSSGKKRKGRK